MRRLCVLLLLASACGTSEPASSSLDYPNLGGVGGDSKTDAIGRQLVGLASPYPADTLDDAALQANFRLRRETAWATALKILAPVPLVGVVDAANAHPELSLPGGKIPMIPRFESWYGIEDIKRMFQYLYGNLTPAERAVHAPFTSDAIDAAFTWNVAAADRSSRWPLDRYLAYIRALGMCPANISNEDCALMVQSNINGVATGTTRIMYDPATVKQVLSNYGNILDCLGKLDQLTLTAQPTDANNFTACFENEMPIDAVLVKAQWVRADLKPNFPTFDTDADSLTRRIAPGATALWVDEGDRTTTPGADSIYTIRLQDGSIFRLAGVHIMTKELRHWQWITIWWSDKPHSDFGEDRPDAFGAQLAPLWSNYKLCNVTAFEEADAAISTRYPDRPSLQASLGAFDHGAGAPTWCSNPYVEHARNNARTNCIGCHQHAGSTVAQDSNGDGKPDPFVLDNVIANESLYPENGRKRIRDVFPSDYLYSFNRVDDFSHMLKGEVDYSDRADADQVAARVAAITALPGDIGAGATLFSGKCTGCHGADGHGGTIGPNLSDRVPNLDQPTLLRTLISGRGEMPAWGDKLQDQDLANVAAFLRANF